MQLRPERQLDGVIERRFVLGEIPGILWTPPAATRRQAPLILAGQPAGSAGLDLTYPRLYERARHAAQAGFATATIELPGGGDRPQPPGVDEARAELREAIAASEPVSDDIVDRLVLPLVDQAVPEWRATIDALLELPGLGGQIGYSGGVISIGVRLAATEPRLSAAVLFAGSFVPRSILAEARKIVIPLHVLLQWDDAGNDRQMALDLFDAFGSPDKTLTANLGGHTGVPPHAGEEALRFLARHLNPAADGDG